MFSLFHKSKKPRLEEVIESSGNNKILWMDAEFSQYADPTLQKMVIAELNPKKNILKKAEGNVRVYCPDLKDEADKGLFLAYKQYNLIVGASHLIDGKNLVKMHDFHMVIIDPFCVHHEGYEYRPQQVTEALPEFYTRNDESPVYAGFSFVESLDKKMPIIVYTIQNQNHPNLGAMQEFARELGVVEYLFHETLPSEVVPLIKKHLPT